jgi:hypothetical protein
MKYSFNAAIASFLIMLSVVVVILIISSYVYHQSSGPDFINDPQFREMNNLDTAVSIVENDSLFKEVATSGMVSSSSCSSVDPASRGYLNYTGQLYEVHMNTKGQPSYHFEALVDIDNRTVLNITRIKINQL